MPESVSPVSDDQDFVVRLDAAIAEAALHLAQRRSGVRGEGAPIQLRAILEGLLRIRDEARSGTLVTREERQRMSFSPMFVDGWDMWDPFGQRMFVVEQYYRKRRDHVFPKELLATPDALAREAAVEDARALLRTQDPRIGPIDPIDPPAGSRAMPHRPDPGSLLTVRSFAGEAEPRLRRDAPAARERRDARHFADWAQQHAVIALLDYWLGKPAVGCADRLSEACDVQLQAIGLGLEPDPWQVEEWLTTAIAIDHLPLANRLADLGRQRWGHERVKPVQWLVARIAALIALWRKDEPEADALLAIEHEALYDVQLPPELTPDLPLMRSHFWLLRTLRLRDAAGFDEALAERMRVRADHFRAGGTIAPAAMIDLAALATCRLARARGIEPRVRHVYLPLEIIGSR